MKKVKEFLNKKTNDIKFKNAGTGHKLSDSSSALSAASSSNDSAPASYAARRTGPDANVASAALARFENKTTKPTGKATLHDIMTEEKKKIMEDMKLKDEAIAFKQMQAKQHEEGQKNPFEDFENAQLFTCTALGIVPSVPFKDLMSKVKEKIFDNFSDDPVIRSIMVLFNCNRNIKQDESRLTACVDILKKIVSNMQNASPEEFEKYSRIRRSKIEQKVLSLDGALDLLYAIGFTHDIDNEEDPDWLVYVLQDEDLGSKLQLVQELLLAPQIFPFELDRQLRHITGESAAFNASANDAPEEDLKMTSSDLKSFYSNLEKTREINEMFISKDARARLLANSPNFKPIFTKLRFKFNIPGANDIETVEGTFYVNENLTNVKDWFSSNFGSLFGEKEIHFKVGPEQFSGESMFMSLADLKLIPAATLTVMIK